MYRLPDNQVCELVAYELMSANDAPERDPSNWYDVRFWYRDAHLTLLPKFSHTSP